jgi:hypothetical protein
MKDRLKELIKYKTNGKHKDFAEMLGWTQAYLAKLAGGGSMGLQPVITILEALPEINARWFLTGKGSMLVDEFRESDLHKETMSHIQAVLDLEKFVPVMSPDEVLEFEKVVKGHLQPDFTPEAKMKWVAKAAEQYQIKESRIRSATNKSDELCRQQTAKE